MDGHEQDYQLVSIPKHVSCHDMPITAALLVLGIVSLCRKTINRTLPELKIGSIQAGKALAETTTP